MRMHGVSLLSCHGFKNWVDKRGLPCAQQAQAIYLRSRGSARGLRDLYRRNDSTSECKLELPAMGVEAPISLHGAKSLRLYGRWWNTLTEEREMIENRSVRTARATPPLNANATREVAGLRRFGSWRF